MHYRLESERERGGEDVPQSLQPQFLLIRRFAPLKEWWNQVSCYQRRKLWIGSNEKLFFYYRFFRSPHLTLIIKSAVFNRKRGVLCPTCHRERWSVSQGWRCCGRGMRRPPYSGAVAHLKRSSHPSGTDVTLLVWEWRTCSRKRLRFLYPPCILSRNSRFW